MNKSDLHKETVSIVEPKNGWQIIDLKEHKGALLVTLESNEKVFIETMKNSNAAPSYSNKFIKQGDTLIKKVDSDTIWIKRGDESFYFLK